MISSALRPLDGATARHKTPTLLDVKRTIVMHVDGSPVDRLMELASKA